MTWKMTASWLFGLGFLFNVVWDWTEEISLEVLQTEKEFEVKMIIFAFFVVFYMLCSQYLRKRYDVNKWKKYDKWDGFT